MRRALWRKRSGDEARGSVFRQGHAQTCQEALQLLGAPVSQGDLAGLLVAADQSFTLQGLAEILLQIADLRTFFTGCASGRFFLGFGVGPVRSQAPREKLCFPARRRRLPQRRARSVCG